MFCTKCGFQVPDGSATCTNCGAPLTAPEAPAVPTPAAPAPEVAPVAPAPAQAPVVQTLPVAAPAASAASNIDMNFGAFMKDLFSNPVDAVTSRAKAPFWVLGVICAGVFAVLQFILALIDFEYKTAQWGFYYLLTEIFAFAGLALFTMLFTSVFKIKKLDFLSSVSLAGLAYCFMAPARLIAFINTKIYNAIDINFFSISSIFTSIATLFVVICLYDFAINNKDAAKGKVNAFLFTICTMAGYYLTDLFFSWMFTKMFFS